MKVPSPLLWNIYSSLVPLNDTPSPLPLLIFTVVSVNSKCSIPSIISVPSRPATLSCIVSVPFPLLVIVYSVLAPWKIKVSEPSPPDNMSSFSLALLTVEEFSVADSLASASLQSSIYSSAAILQADDVGVSVLRGVALLSLSSILMLYL